MRLSNKPKLKQNKQQDFPKEQTVCSEHFFMNKCTCKTSRRVLVGRIRDILKMSSMRISCARCSDVLCTTEKKSACFFHRKKVTTFCFLGIEKYDKYLLKNQNCNSNPLLCFYAHKLFLRIQLIAKQKRLKPKIN